MSCIRRCRSRRAGTARRPSRLPSGRSCLPMTRIGLWVGTKPAARKAPRCSRGTSAIDGLARARRAQQLRDLAERVADDARLGRGSAVSATQPRERVAAEGAEDPVRARRAEVAPVEVRVRRRAGRFAARRRAASTSVGNRWSSSSIRSSAACGSGPPVARTQIRPRQSSRQPSCSRKIGREASFGKVTPSRSRAAAASSSFARSSRPKMPLPRSAGSVATWSGIATSCSRPADPAAEEAHAASPTARSPFVLEGEQAGACRVFVEPPVEFRAGSAARPRPARAGRAPQLVDRLALTWTTCRAPRSAPAARASRRPCP